MSNDDAPRRDPVAEQNEAARRFQERTGRKSTDPAPPGVMRIGIGPDGRPRVETFGYERDPNDEFDPFQRAGIERVHHAPSEIEQTPDAVIGHFKGGSDPTEAVRKVLAAADELGMLGAPAPKYRDVVEASVVCARCAKLMEIFGDNKIDEDCGRCHGTGIEPDADENPPVPG